MKTVIRLVMAYALGTRVLRIFSVVGFATIILSFLLLDTRPQSIAVFVIAFAGAAAFFLGSSLMPVMFGQLARGRLIRVLPLGRARLLASLFITVTIVALPTPLLELIGSQQALNLYVQNTHGATAAHLAISNAAIERIRAGSVENFWLTLAASFQLTAGLYLTLWFITSQRSVAGYAKGLLVILFMMSGPAHFFRQYSITARGSLAQIGTAWLLFGAGFLLWPRWQAIRLRWRGSLQSFSDRFLGKSTSGREADLILGTANPWLLIVVQLVPVAFASTIGFYSAAVWLFYLTIFSTVAGAIACHAAERSRVLWLRGGWSRPDLFAVVERSFWRHNSFVLGALIALMVGIGSYAALPVSLLAAGLPLLLISTVLSTYLGLMVTRGLRWVEGTLAVIVMLALMAVAVVAARSQGNSRDLVIVIALEGTLALSALGLRSAAKSRWQSIDWMLARPERVLRTRAA